MTKYSVESTSQQACIIGSMNSPRNSGSINETLALKGLDIVHLKEHWIFGRSVQSSMARRDLNLGNLPQLKFDENKANFYELKDQLLIGFWRLCHKYVLLA